MEQRSKTKDKPITIKEQSTELKVGDVVEHLEYPDRKDTNRWTGIITLIETPTEDTRRHGWGENNVIYVRDPFTVFTTCVISDNLRKSEVNIFDLSKKLLNKLKDTSTPGDMTVEHKVDDFYLPVKFTAISGEDWEPPQPKIDKNLPH